MSCSVQSCSQHRELALPFRPKSFHFHRLACSTNPHVSFFLCCSWSDFACRAFHVFPFLSLACVYVSHPHGLSPSARLQQCFNETQLGLCRLALRVNFIHDFGASKCPDCRLSHCRRRETTYSLRGLNPRPMAHKTIALTTELRELRAGQ